MPVLAKLTYIYSLMTRRVNPASTTDLRRFLYLVYTPVFTYWNPYNTELRIPDDTLGCLSSTYQVFPMRTQFYLQNTAQTVSHQGLSTNNLSSYLRSGNGGDIVFKPGEFRIFSHSSLYPGGTSGKQNLVPGFDPSAYGGDLLQISIRNPSENPGFAIYFGHSEWGGNINFGNTPGSLNFVSYWGPQAGATKWIPLMYQNDWFNLSQQYTPLTPDPQPGANRVATRPGNILRWNFSDESPVPVGFSQHVLKGASSFNHESIPSWRKDWRCRNWLQAPPFYFGNNMYISENNDIAQTQRTDNAFVVNFGGMSASEMPKVVPHIGNNGFLGSGAAPVEKVTSAAALELPTAPMGSLAGYAAMRTNPGWARASAINPNLFLSQTGAGNLNIASLGFALVKQNAYQSGVTGPGIGNSFLHPMIPRGDVYRYFNNSISQDPHDRNQPLGTITANDNMVFCDYWDHTFLLNDALWDDYFVSSLADQTRPSASTATSLDESIRRLVSGGQIPNSRYIYWPNGRTSTEVESDLKSTDGFLKCAGHLLVDGSFNVNSTSVAAWRALFAGIRERQAVYRDGSGMLRNIPIPSGKRIALTRFNTEVANSEMATPENGTTMPDGMPGWSGVRFLSDDEIRKLAEECVAQVKRRGPFLNFSEFINRRLSNDELGIMGALQSAIDYDDFLSGPEAQSLNFRFKNGNAHLLKPADVDINGYATPEAAVGSRFAGIPGYLVQSDILKPIANTLTVRDDTFRIRAYGESRDATGRVTARAWCEAILQRTPEYCDPANPAETPMRLIGPDGSIKDANQLNATNLKFGRRFRMESFRWLGKDEV